MSSAAQKSACCSSRRKHLQACASTDPARLRGCLLPLLCRLLVTARMWHLSWCRHSKRFPWRCAPWSGLGCFPCSGPLPPASSSSFISAGEPCIWNMYIASHVCGQCRPAPGAAMPASLSLLLARDSSTQQPLVAADCRQHCAAAQPGGPAWSRAAGLCAAAVLPPRRANGGVQPASLRGPAPDAAGACSADRRQRLSQGRHQDE